MSLTLSPLAEVTQYAAGCFTAVLVLTAAVVRCREDTLGSVLGFFFAAPLIQEGIVREEINVQVSEILQCGH